MKSVMWINKDLMIAEDYRSYFDKEKVLFNPFCDFESAYDFLMGMSNEIDLIVSGNCTFQWIDRPHVNPNDVDICFNFF